MDRRTSLKLLTFTGLAGAGISLPGQLLAQGSRASSSLDPYAGMRWSRGFEGQRKADLGHGSFLNPVFAGDYPDPTILRDGNDYYLTFSSFDAYPGIVIWHSRDLSGYHHNVAYDFLSLRPALYSAGGGEASFANFTYRAL